MVLMGTPVVHNNNLLPYCYAKKIMFVKNLEESKLSEEKTQPHSRYQMLAQLTHVKTIKFIGMMC